MLHGANLQQVRGREMGRGRQGKHGGQEGRAGGRHWDWEGESEEGGILGPALTNPLLLDAWPWGVRRQVARLAGRLRTHIMHIVLLCML